MSKEDALELLRVALKLATETSLLDDVALHVHPDIINNFCDTITLMSGKV